MGEIQIEAACFKRENDPETQENEADNLIPEDSGGFGHGRYYMLNKLGAVTYGYALPSHKSMLTGGHGRPAERNGSQSASRYIVVMFTVDSNDSSADDHDL